LKNIWRNTTGIRCGLSSFGCLGGFGVPLFILPLQNTGFPMRTKKDQAGEGMHNSEGKQGRAAGEADVTGGDECVGCDSTGKVPDRSIKALSITEISDKDYRSFCWPCYELEETGDGET